REDHCQCCYNAQFALLICQTDLVLDSIDFLHTPEYVHARMRRTAHCFSLRRTCSKSHWRQNCHAQKPRQPKLCSSGPHCRRVESSNCHPRIEDFSIELGARELGPAKSSAPTRLHTGRMPTQCCKEDRCRRTLRFP